MTRYIIADPATGNGWGHLFAEPNFDKDDGSAITRERICRFIYDTEQGKLIHLDVTVRGALSAADEAENADVEDSLKTANPNAIEDPGRWGLIGSDDLPDWHPQAPAISM